MNNRDLQKVRAAMRVMGAFNAALDVPENVAEFIPKMGLRGKRVAFGLGMPKSVRVRLINLRTDDRERGYRQPASGRRGRGLGRKTLERLAVE